LFDCGDDAGVDNIFCLVRGDLVELLSVLFILSHHVVFLLYVLSELFEHAPVFLCFETGDLLLHAFALLLVEAVFEFAV
jgi:hypothetical protein